MLDLRTVLTVDAIASGGLGAALIVIAGVLEDPLGLPVFVAVAVGAFLVVWAGFVAWAARRGSVTAVKEIIAVNGAYAVTSVAFAVSGWVDLTGLGVAFVLLQAAVVAALALLQVAACERPGGMRRRCDQEPVLRTRRWEAQLGGRSAVRGLRGDFPSPALSGSGGWGRR